MYDTVATATTSSYVGNHEIPLHSSSEGVLLSSLSLSAFMIQRPEPDVSFSWSDFPMVVKEDNKHTRYASSSSSSSGSSISNHSSSSTLSDFSSTSSRMNLLEESTSSSTRTATRDLCSQRNVRFSQHLEVRTYNLVLGDHPLGSNGLAIENGWEYDSHDGEKIDMNLHEDCKHNINWSRQRSHLDKKRLLLEVAGCSIEELNERTNTYQEEQRAAAQQRRIFIEEDKRINK